MSKMHATLSVVLGLAALSLSAGSHAETFSVLGKSLELTPPPEFCELGQTPREAALRQLQQRNFAPAGELAQLVVPCDELEAFKAGSASSFTRWADVLVAKRQGQLNLVTVSRQEFIRSTAGNMGTPVDMSEINRRANEHRSSSKIKVAMSGMQPIGATKDAFFVQGQMSAQTNGDSTSMIVIVAATVANQLPIMVHVYATPKATGAPPMQSATDYVSNILRKN